jgi:catechol 2,3-dioxygenase-like lactoylglutathione lyase family enzyme
MVDLEVGGLRHASSITKDGARNVGFYTGVLGMGLLYRSLNFDDPSIHHLALANGGYEFNLALAGMALTLLIIGAGAYSLDSFVGILW